MPLLDQSFLASDKSDEEADAFSARVGLVALRGSFSVASSNKLITTISVDIRDHEVVILDFSDTVYVDDSAALVVEQMIDSAIAEDTECIIMGLTGPPAATLRALNVLHRVPAAHFVKSLDEAKEYRATASGQVNFLCTRPLVSPRSNRHWAPCEDGFPRARLIDGNLSTTT